MILDPSNVRNLILFGTAFAGAFGAALWLSLVFWTYRDIKSRTKDPLMRILAVLVTAILFLPGILIYLVLRPPRTIEDNYQRTLEDEALLQTIEDRYLCPGCNRSIEPDWIVCPSCHTRIKTNCQACHRPLELSWEVCPFCGSPGPGGQKQAEKTFNGLD